MAPDGHGLADAEAGQEDEPVSRRDEGGQVLEPVGIGAEHDRSEHLGAARHHDDEQRAGAVLAAEERAGGDQDQPGRGAQQKLLVAFAK